LPIRSFDTYKIEWYENRAKFIKVGKDFSFNKLVGYLYPNGKSVFSASGGVTVATALLAFELLPALPDL
jgi:hypothetical protein